jgi:glycerate-2-kinase
MLLEDIFLEALPSIDPKRLVLESLREKSFSNEKVHVIGFGKAAAGMAAGIIEFFGENIIEGIISVPVGTRQSMGTLNHLKIYHKIILEQNNRTDLWPVHERVKVFEVAKDNLPDQAAVGLGSYS